MAGTWVGELFDSRPGVIAFRELQSTRRYGVTGTENQDDVITLAASNVPAFVSVGGASQFIREIKYNPKGGGQWEVLAQYGFTRPSWELLGDSGGGSAKILRARKTINTYRCAPSATIPDFSDGINVTPESVEGVDIVIPKDEYSITQKYQLAALSSSYLDVLRRLTGKTNNATFTLTWQDQVIAFGLEECLYMGRTFKQTSTSEMEITHKFSGQQSKLGGTVTTANFTQPSVSGTVTITVTASDLFSIGNTVYILTSTASTTHGTYIVSDIPDATHLELVFMSGTTPATSNIVSGALVSLDEEPIYVGTSGPMTKRGWHYLWTSMQRQVSGSLMIPRPRYAVVQRVYDRGDFSLIGL